jgi:hypothetical protein
MVGALGDDEGALLPVLLQLQLLAVAPGAIAVVVVGGNLSVNGARLSNPARLPFVLAPPSQSETVAVVLLSGARWCQVRNMVTDACPQPISHEKAAQKSHTSQNACSQAHVQ